MILWFSVFIFYGLIVFWFYGFKILWFFGFLFLRGGHFSTLDAHSGFVLCADSDSESAYFQLSLFDCRVGFGFRLASAIYAMSDLAR